MKKVFPILIILFALTLILQYVVNMMLNDHVIEYSIKTEDNSYMIKESFRYLNEESYYDFTVTDEKDLFYTFSFNEDFNKQEGVIEDIEFFTTKDLQCIYPIYKRNLTGNLSCIYKGNQVSYSYLEQIDNYDINLMTTKLKEMGYEHKDWEKETNKATNIENTVNTFAYMDNVLDDYYFTMWGYRGVMIISNTNATYRVYLNQDQYDNKNSALVGKYYITVEDGNEKFNYFVMYNVKDFGKGVINTEKNVIVSDNFYFNGVFKNKLYVTDLEHRQQLEVNPVTEKAIVVGNERDGFLTVKDGKLIKVKADEFLKENVYFVKPLVDERFKELGAIDIIKENTSYYFITKDGGVYRSSEDRIYKPVLLFKLDGLTEWRVKNGDILAVAGDSVYFYNVGVGLRKIATNNELKYNHKNIVDFWKD